MSIATGVGTYSACEYTGRHNIGSQYSQAVHQLMHFIKKCSNNQITYSMLNAFKSDQTLV